MFPIEGERGKKRKVDSPLKASFSKLIYNFTQLSRKGLTPPKGVGDATKRGLDFTKAQN